MSLVVCGDRRLLVTGGYWWQEVICDRRLSCGQFSVDRGVAVGHGDRRLSCGHRSVDRGAAAVGQ